MIRTIIMKYVNIITYMIVVVVWAWLYYFMQIRLCSHLKKKKSSIFEYEFLFTCIQFFCEDSKLFLFLFFFIIFFFPALDYCIWISSHSHK